MPSIILLEFFSAEKLRIEGNSQNRKNTTYKNFMLHGMSKSILVRQEAADAVRYRFLKTKHCSIKRTQEISCENLLKIKLSQVNVACSSRSDSGEQGICRARGKNIASANGGG